MTSGLAILTIGFLLGMRHATDPDHVIAFSTIVSRERSTDALIHHGEAVVRERLIIHQVPAVKEPPLGRFSHGS